MMFRGKRVACASGAEKSRQMRQEEMPVAEVKELELADVCGRNLGLEASGTGGGIGAAGSYTSPSSFALLFWLGRGGNRGRGGSEGAADEEGDLLRHSAGGGGSLLGVGDLSRLPTLSREFELEVELL